MDDGVSEEAWAAKWAEVTGAVRSAMLAVEGVELGHYENGEGGFSYTVTIGGETQQAILTFT